VELTETDREVITALLENWEKSEHALPGNLSYEHVLSFVHKCGVKEPSELIHFLQRIGEAGHE
jgi:hypothetical protein